MGQLSAMKASRVLLLLCCLLAVGECCGFSQHDTDMTAVKVFSSLQTSDGMCDHTFPVPSGIPLTLTCQIFLHKPSWWEWDKQVCPSSKFDRDAGIYSIKFIIDRLSSRDHARKLTCTASDINVHPTTVSLYVVDKMPRLSIILKGKKVDFKTEEAQKNPNAFLYSKFKPRFLCTAENLDPALKLCWFKDGKRVGCQEILRKPRTRTVLTMSLDENFEPTELVCKPQLRQDPAPLTPQALNRFKEMFESAQKTVYIEGWDEDTEQVEMDLLTKLRNHALNTDQAEATPAPVPATSNCDADSCREPCSVSVQVKEDSAGSAAYIAGYLMPNKKHSRVMPNLPTGDKQDIEYEYFDEEVHQDPTTSTTKFVDSSPKPKSVSEAPPTSTDHDGSNPSNVGRLVAVSLLAAVAVVLAVALVCSIYSYLQVKRDFEEEKKKNKGNDATSSKKKLLK